MMMVLVREERVDGRMEEKGVSEGGGGWREEEEEEEEVKRMGGKAVSEFALSQGVKRGCRKAAEK